MDAYLDALHRAFHDPRSRANRVLEAVVAALILLSIGFFAYEIRALGMDGDVPRWVWVADRALLGLFGVEMVLRVATFRPPEVAFYRQTHARRLRGQVLGRLRFLASPLMLVDLVTVLAFFPPARGLRAFRLLRLLRAHMLLRRESPLRGVAATFHENRMLYAFAMVVLGLEVLIGGLTLFLFEFGQNPDMTSPADGMWWAIVTITTVGFGDITPATGAGRLVGVLLMIGGLFTIALFAGIVGSTLLRAVLRLQEDQFRMSAQIDHIVVCGYHEGARMLLDVLRAQPDFDDTPVVLFGPFDRPAEVPAEFTWVRGDPTKESELAKVRLAEARTAILIGSRGVPPHQADAATILTAFTMRRYLRAHAGERARPLYLIAEILEDENVDHARAAGCNEVIETNRLGFALLTHAIREPGAAHIMSGVAVLGGQNIYLGPIPPEAEQPLTFGALREILQRRYGALLIGVRDPVSGRDSVNPGPDFPVAPGLRVVYLAPREVVPDPEG